MSHIQQTGTTQERACPSRRRACIVADTLASIYPDDLRTPLNYTTDWELLVAVILSAQCTDEMVNKVTAQLFKKYPALDDYISADPQEFEQDIRSTGFYRSKTRAVLASASIIKEEHGGRIPDTMDELLRLPGVGRKTANVILGHLYDHVEGIAVDTHVMRLARKFGLTAHANPEKIEQDLMRLFPKDDWWRVSYQLKAYGREYSTARQNTNYTDPVSTKLHANGLL